MDAIALEGYAAVISGLIVFCGSVWLLLAVVMGSRLAYFVTATVTLAFLFMMGLVWSTTELGPLGDLPSWNGVAAGSDTSGLDFGAASSYPEGEWYEADAEDEEQLAQITEAEGAATEFVDHEIEEGKIDEFDSAADKVATTESTRLIEVGGDLYAATLFQEAAAEGEEDQLEPAQVGDPGTVLAIVSYDPGNPLGLARQILAGTTILLILHMIGLARAERKAKEITERYA